MRVSVDVGFGTDFSPRQQAIWLWSLQRSTRNRASLYSLAHRSHSSSESTPSSSSSQSTRRTPGLSNRATRPSVPVPLLYNETSLLERAHRRTSTVELPRTNALSIRAHTSAPALPAARPLVATRAYPTRDGRPNWCGRPAAALADPPVPPPPRIYSRAFILSLYQSPLVPARPAGMRSLSEWFG